VSREARRNLIALLIAGLIVLLFAALAARPAVLLPVTDRAVADSLNSPAGTVHAECLHVQDGFRCVVRIPRDSDPAVEHQLLVHVDWDGCWRAAEDASKRSPLRESGCVHLWNY
jgi:hypothetical protein